MSIVEGERVLDVKTEAKWLRYQFDVEFRHFVGRHFGDSELQKFPDITLGADPETPINPDWVEVVQPINRRISRPHPGPLTYNPHTERWEAVDPNSPVGRIAAIQDGLRQEMEASPLSGQRKKQVEKETRAELVDIFNGYAGLRFNNQRDIVNGLDFRGINVDFMAASSLRYWQMELVAARGQSVNPILFTRWEEADKKIKTPTMADLFILKLFEQPDTAADDSQLAAAKIFKTLLDLEQGKGYLAIANVLYGGDMLKTFLNLSAVARMTNRSLPEGWQQFQGSTTEFKRLQDTLTDFSPGLEGYLKAADDLYGGDMLKTFLNLSAVARMTNRSLPEGWQQFQGSTTEFKRLQDTLTDFSPGLEGYLKAADALYAGDMFKTFINLSAVARMTGKTLPQGWQGFKGSTTEFKSLQDTLTAFSPGLEGYLKAADALYAGDMFKTFLNLSAVARMTNRSLPEGWQQFQGSTTEFKSQRDWLIAKSSSTVEEFINRFSSSASSSERKKARRNFAAVRKMNLPEGKTIGI